MSGPPERPVFADVARRVLRRVNGIHFAAGLKMSALWVFGSALAGMVALRVGGLSGWELPLAFGAPAVWFLAAGVRAILRRPSPFAALAALTAGRRHCEERSGESLCEQDDIIPGPRSPARIR